jgi:hypothetical protein
MKKATKNRLMALSILVIFGFSSIAYVASSFTGTQTEAKRLTSYVINGEIDQTTEASYAQNGYTFLKLYYNSTIDSAIVDYLEQAPDMFITVSNEKQLYVQKIPAETNYIRITNLNVDTQITNITQDAIYTDLCNYLMVLPTECALIGLNFTA